MAYTSTVPAAVAALLTRLAASPDLAGVLIKDAGQLTDPDATEVLSVGYQGDAEDLAVDGQMRREGAAVTPDREQYDIRCAVVTANGDEDLGAARTRAFALLDAVGAVLAQDWRLGGTVMNAALTTWSLRLDAAQGGAYATIRFAISVDAYTGR